MSLLTAATVKPGDFLEFPTIPVIDCYPIREGRFAGYIMVTYARPFDGSAQWRMYPADFQAVTR